MNRMSGTGLKDSKDIYCRLFYVLFKIVFRIGSLLKAINRIFTELRFGFSQQLVFVIRPQIRFTLGC